MNTFWAFIRDHGTKILGVVQGTVALLCGMNGLIPDSQMKYWLAASAVLTYWRGQGNTNAIAQAVVNKQIQNLADAEDASVPLSKPQPGVKK